MHIQAEMGETERSMAVAYSVLSAVAVGALGSAIDGWLGTRPWLAVLGLVGGATIALLALRRLMIENRGGR
jgi:hypothetical protein